MDHQSKPTIVNDMNCNHYQLSLINIIVRTRFEILAQGMNELGPKKPKTMNL